MYHFIICCVLFIGLLTILQINSINRYCSIPLLEEGPIILKSLGPVSNLPINSYYTVYTCTGQSPSDQLCNMYSSNGVWDYYKNQNENSFTNNDSNSSSGIHDDIHDNIHDDNVNVTSVINDSNSVLKLNCTKKLENVENVKNVKNVENVSEMRQSSRLLCKKPKNFRKLANPWRKKRQVHTTRVPTATVLTATVPTATCRKRTNTISRKMFVGVVCNNVGMLGHTPLSDHTYSNIMNYVILTDPPAHQIDHTHPNANSDHVSQSDHTHHDDHTHSPLITDKWLSDQRNGPSIYLKKLNLSLASNNIAMVS